MKQAKTIGILQFPGTNCEWDCEHICKDILGLPTQVLWHTDRIKQPEQYAALIVPGGFAYGDYLRAGAMAMLSPIVEDLLQFAQAGGAVLGICNGFQILTELRLLPGTMLTNQSLRYVCRDVYLKLECDQCLFTKHLQKDTVLKMPVSHQQGCYFVDAAAWEQLQQSHAVVFRYCNEAGEFTEESNPNGSSYNIAGVMNGQGNVLGLMPHPDRCAEAVLGGIDGLQIFKALVA